MFLDFVIVTQKNATANLEDRVGALSNNVTHLGSLTGSFGGLTGTPAGQIAVQSTNACPQSCTTLINAAIGTLRPAAVATKVPAVSQKGEYVIPLGSGLVSAVGAWTDAYTVQAAVEPGNYANIKVTYFEVVTHIPDGQGQMRVKLYDASTPFSFDGQELDTTSSTGQLQSVPVALLPGRKIYRVQVFNTFSPGVVDEARIRIVTQ